MATELVAVGRRIIRRPRLTKLLDETRLSEANRRAHEASFLTGQSVATA